MEEKIKRRKRHIVADPMGNLLAAVVYAANTHDAKEEEKEAEQIRRSGCSILRQEQREQQLRRARDMERYQAGRRDSQRLSHRPILVSVSARKIGINCLL